MIHNGLAAGIGAGVGIIPALLINRYLLKNKTGSSALRAALIGGGIGAAGGIGLNTYLRSRAITDNQELLQALHAHQDAEEAKLLKMNTELASIDPSAEDAEAQIRQRLAEYSGLAAEEIPNEVIDPILNNLEASKWGESFDRKSAKDKLFAGTETSVVPFNEDTYKLLDTWANQYRTRSESEIQKELAFGNSQLFDDHGNGTKEVFDRILFSQVGSAANYQPERLSALINYHNKVRTIAANDPLMKKFPDNLRHEYVDYIALKSLPQSQQSLVPVTHRLSAIARARASKGWSYEFDWQTITNPDYFHKEIAIPTLKENLFDTGVILSSVSPWGAIPVTVGGLADMGISKHFSNLPTWSSRYSSTSGDTIGRRYNRHAAVNLLTDYSNGVPIYSWQAPELGRNKILRGAFTLASTLVDAGFDIKHMMKGKNAPIRGFITDRLAKSNKKFHKTLYKLRSKGLSPYVDGNNALSVGFNTLSGISGISEMSQGRELLNNKDLAEAAQLSAITNTNGRNALMTAFDTQLNYLRNRKRNR